MLYNLGTVGWGGMPHPVPGLRPRASGQSLEMLLGDAKTSRKRCLFEADGHSPPDMEVLPLEHSSYQEAFSSLGSTELPKSLRSQTPPSPSASQVAKNCLLLGLPGGKLPGLHQTCLGTPSHPLLLLSSFPLLRPPAAAHWTKDQKHLWPLKSPTSVPSHEPSRRAAE